MVTSKPLLTIEPTLARVELKPDVRERGTFSSN